VLRSFEDVETTALNPTDSLQRTAMFELPGAIAKSGADLMRFASCVVLKKDEALEACEWLAAAGRLLFDGGHYEEASSLGVLFDRLEDRLTLEWETFERAPTTRLSPLNSSLACCFESACSGLAGSNSSESELMQ